MITNYIDTNLSCFKFSNVQRAFFGQCHFFLLLLGVVLSLTWFPSVQAATDCTAVTEIPQVECEALVALYNSTDGSNWKDSPDNNWNVTNTPCSWTGVTCVDGHVTGISLYKNQLNGSLPSELGNLSQLTYLNLGGDYWHATNQLSGSIPSELGNLSQLKFLSLDWNQLSGSIPNELGNLSQLTVLKLDNNQLSGSIPSELGNLSQLTVLDLYDNQLSGSIPSQLGNLSQLTVLELDNNQLSGSIPRQLGNLSQLTELDLYDNQLSGSIPSQLGNLSQLTSLELYGNQLSGSIPSQLGNLSQLTYLDLWDNQLSGSIPSELGNLIQLTYLRLSSNQLSGEIPPSLSNLSNLSEESNNNGLNFNNGLNLGYNQLTASDVGLISFLNIKDPDWAETQTKSPPSSKSPSSSSFQMASRCLSSRVIVGACSNHGQVLTDVTFGSYANVARGELAGIITNQGILSNVTVQPGAVVSGGKLTGYIKNAGTLTDFEFVGASITGGTLSGTIYNNSKVGGFFQDVQLAADTHIIGGVVSGDIQGDCEAPAKLENIIVESGSHLSCVIIDNGSEQGDSIVLAEGVTFGQGVQFAHLKISSETAEEETLPNLYPLSGAIAINAQGETVEIGRASCRERV